MPDAAAAARQMWGLFEPVHTVTYFAPEALSAFEGAGLRGFWRGYFAGRAAPLGVIGAAPVTAAFFSFAPPMVARALPAVWELIAPDATGKLLAVLTPVARACAAAPLPQPRRRARPGARCPLTKPGERHPQAKPGGYLTKPGRRHAVRPVSCIIPKDPAPPVTPILRGHDEALPQAQLRKPRSRAPVPSRCSATARRVSSALPARIASTIAACWPAV